MLSIENKSRKIKPQFVDRDASVSEGFFIR